MPQDPRDPRDEPPGDNRPDDERHDDGSGDGSEHRPGAASADRADGTGHRADDPDHRAEDPGDPTPGRDDASSDPSAGRDDGSSDPSAGRDDGSSDTSGANPSSAIPDDLSGLSPDDIPDDLSGLDLGGLPEPPIEPTVGPYDVDAPSRPDAPDAPDASGQSAASDRDAPRSSPHGSLAEDAGAEAGGADDDGEAVPGPVPTGGPVDPRTPRQRLRDRYLEIRVATMDRDGGPGVVLRWSARAPLVSTLVLAVLVGGVLVVTFGVPPVSPLFLIPVLCGPVYPWLRVESNAQSAWRERNAGAG